MDYQTAHTLLVVISGALLTCALVGALVQAVRIVVTFVGRMFS